MDSVSQYGRPLVVDAFEHGASVQALTRLHLDPAKSGAYSEGWLQRLIHRHPNLLPIDQIEPALIPLIPVCLELPTPSGSVDNLFVTPDGELVLVECKLWRNPEARRKVVGQILDYAKDLASWDYQDLEAAIRKAARPDAEGGWQGMRLYDLVAGAAAEVEVDEARFIDAVSRNLRRGRFLLLIVGDGIQAGAERLAEFLQQHAGLHFTLALVELAIFELPASAGILVQPRVPARTLNVERGIVTVEDGANVAVLGSRSATLVGAPKRSRRTTISEEKFFEELGADDPGLPERLRAFLDELEPLGIQPEHGQTSLILRWQPDELHKFNLGTIETNGEVLTRPVNWVADYIGRLDISHRYLERLADLVGGVVKRTPKRQGWSSTTRSGEPVRLADLLDRSDGWRAAIEEFIDAATDTLRSAADL
jgi:hypothetical protein